MVSSITFMQIICKQIYLALTVTSTSGKSGPGSNCNKGVTLYSPGALSTDAVLCYMFFFLGVWSYPLLKMQLTYSKPDQQGCNNIR